VYDALVLTGPVLAAITFGCVFGAALFGSFLRDRLPAPHLTRESQDVVRLGMGLVATMTALLLGLVTAAARSSYDVQDSAIKNSAINLLTLDRHLARYGEVTRPTRDLLRAAVSYRLDVTWPDEDDDAGSSEPVPIATIESIQDQLLALTPQTDAERFYKVEALKLSEEVMKTRWRLLGITSSIPRAFLFVVVFWLAMTFASFGLYAPRNATVVGALFIGAVSVALALFLIVELDGPFDGYVKVSSAPVRFALENMGK
jgi:hypothetical protein